MKIRNGFVSNSSSSSFIVRGGESMEDIATSMLNTVIEDFGDWDNGPKTKNTKIYKGWLKNLKIALKRKDVLSGKIGIVMPSCNYNTYIVQNDDVIYITTANNHMWDINATDIECDEEEYEILRRIIENYFFFDIRNKLIHTNERYDMSENASCPKCKKNAYGFVLNKKGQHICPMCYEGVLKKTKDQIDTERAEKLLKNPPKTDAISSLEV